MNPRVVVMGVGNLLLSDEGVGVHTIHSLKNTELPENVEVLDGGTSSIDLLHIISGVSKLIIVDAVKGGEEPGTIYRFSPEDIKTKKEVITSLHQVNLLDVLDMASKIGERPKSTVIIGIEPKRIDWGLKLSRCIKKKIPKLIDMVLNEVRYA